MHRIPKSLSSQNPFSHYTSPICPISPNSDPIIGTISRLFPALYLLRISATSFLDSFVYFFEFYSTYLLQLFCILFLNFIPFRRFFICLNWRTASLQATHPPHLPHQPRFCPASHDYTTPATSSRNIHVHTFTFIATNHKHNHSRFLPIRLSSHDLDSREVRVSHPRTFYVA